MKRTPIAKRPEFQYALPEDRLLIEKSVPSEEWPSDAAARVARSMTRYVRDLVAQREKEFIQSARVIVNASLDMHDDALRRLEAKGATPLTQDWANFVEEVTRVCEKMMIGLERPKRATRQEKEEASHADV